MLSRQEHARYAKQIILPEMNIKGQELLQAARVLVIGAGGLGCPVLQYLTAAGVGHIGIADGDSIDVSNLQRQVLYTMEDEGQMKAEVAVKKLKALNPHTTFTIHPVFIDASNALDILAGYDIIVDGSDNFATRYLVNDACVILGKPMVSGAIYRFEGQVSVFNYKGGPTYRCIFPEPPGAGESPNCADIGVIATLPGIIGSIQANETLKMITGIGEVLSGKLLVMDTLTMHTSVFNFRPVAANQNITRLNDMPEYCMIKNKEIGYDELQQLLLQYPTLQLVDVRETEEHLAGNMGGANLPLSRLESEYHLLSAGDPVVFYCASGARSEKAANSMAAKGFTQVFSLRNGVNALPAAIGKLK